MSVSIPIPQQVLTVGSHDFGPSTCLGLNTIKIQADVALLAPTETITVEVLASDDGGATWRSIAGISRPGGSLINDDTGLPSTIFYVTTNILGDNTNTNRKIKGTVTTTATFTLGAGSLIGT
jgi:hypothetical protein